MGNQWGQASKITRSNFNLNNLEARPLELMMKRNEAFDPGCFEP